jgi:hypothetical protein
LAVGLLTQHLGQKPFCGLIQFMAIPYVGNWGARIDDQRGKLVVIKGIQGLLIKFLCRMLDAFVSSNISHEAAVKELAFLNAKMPFDRNRPKSLPGNPPPVRSAIQPKLK